MSPSLGSEGWKAETLASHCHQQFITVHDPQDPWGRMNRAKPFKTYSKAWQCSSLFTKHMIIQKSTGVPERSGQGQQNWNWNVKIIQKFPRNTKDVNHTWGRGQAGFWKIPARQLSGLCGLTEPECNLPHTYIIHFRRASALTEDLGSGVWYSFKN